MQEKSKKLGRGETGLLVASLALAGVLVGAGFWVQSSHELPKYNIPTPVMPSPNARDFYLSATKKMSRQAGGMMGTKTNNFTPAQRAAVVAQDAPALAEVRKGFAYPFQNPPARTFSTLFPEYAEYRELARTFALTAQSKAEQGDYAAAAEASLDCMRFGVDVPRGGVLIADLVGIAIEAIGRAQLWRVAEKLKPAEARAAIARLEDIEARRIPASEVITEEKWWSLASSVQLLGQANAMAQLTMSAGMTPNTNGSFDPLKILANLRFSFFDKRQALEDYVKYMDTNAVWVSEPYAPNRPKIPKPTDPLNQIICLDGFENTQLKTLDLTMENALLRITLALSAYRQEKGQYPATLEELVTAKYLTSLPQDPFAAGKAPRYRRISPTKFLLYSIGPDCKDDGGEPVTRVKGPSSGANAKGAIISYLEVGMTGDFVVHVNSYEAVK